MPLMAQGNMDISQHQGTWQGFRRLFIFGTAAIALLLILMALTLL
ncbi:MAG: aa3-type cytochrome c oxidase subunit IV [Alphaproteobacteria bacterium]|jgi:hypothetical protein|nr:aa3-type cytochrome c oxidase subunit IV [Alphaproteobacteria bacterium]